MADTLLIVKVNDLVITITTLLIIPLHHPTMIKLHIMILVIPAR